MRTGCRSLLLAAALAFAPPARGAEAEPPPPAATPAPAPPESTPEPAGTTPAPPVPTPAPAGPDDDEDPALYEGWATPQEPAPPRPEPITLLLTLGAYYTSAGLYLPLTGTPMPHAGQRGEAEIYWSLLRGALVPRFLVLEASVNPMPCLGLAARDWSWGYRRAQVTPDLNLIRALTAGFDEPFALSLFVGNVADFAPPGRAAVRGRGYLGLVISGGLGHIKENVLVPDRWMEAELKLKGDRASEEMKLSWSFRAGSKLHDSPDVTDTLYLGLRRSRVDFQEGPPLLANSGVEYRLDLSLRGRPVRQLLLVDKKWPLGRRVALVLGAGLLWESGRAYTGPLAARDAPGLQVIVRPNLIF